MDEFNVGGGISKVAFTHFSTAVSQLHEDMVRASGEVLARRNLFRFRFMCGNVVPAVVSSGASLSRVAKLVCTSLAVLGFDAQPGDKCGAGEFCFSVSRSAESVRHSICFGQSEASVCWFIAGYASGCATACLNQGNFIVIESSCECAGDAQCHFIGRFEEKWISSASHEAIALRSLQLTAGSAPTDSAAYKLKIDSMVDIVALTLGDPGKPPKEALDAAVKQLSSSFGCTVTVEEFGVLTHSCIHKNDTTTKDRANFAYGPLTLKDSRTYAHAVSFYGNKHSSRKR